MPRGSFVRAPRRSGPGCSLPAGSTPTERGSITHALDRTAAAWKERGGRPPLSSSAWNALRPRLRVAVSGGCGGVGIEAERAQAGVRIGEADHRQRPGAVLAVERRRIVHIEAACGRVVRIVEPEPDVERIR